MKILLDQNISFRLINKLPSFFAELHHVINLGWKDFSDRKIFNAARIHEFDAIITLDYDFEKIIIESGPPPKIIHIKIKNSSNEILALCLENKKESIYKFLSDPDLEYLEILTV